MYVYCHWVCFYLQLCLFETESSQNMYQQYGRSHSSASHTSTPDREVMKSQFPIYSLPQYTEHEKGTRATKPAGNSATPQW